MTRARVVDLVRSTSGLLLFVGLLAPRLAIAETAAPASAPASAAAPDPNATSPAAAASAAATSPVPAPAPESVAAPTPASAPAAAAQPGAPAVGSTVRWPDADDTAGRLGEGSIEACETIIMPLTWIPGIGDVVGTVVEWACLVPALLAIDYVEAHHGQRDSFLWQPAVALVAQKLFRDLLETPTIVGIAALAIIYATAGTAFFAVNPVLLPFLPVGVAGLISLSGIAYVFMYKVKEHAGDWVFDTVYGLLTSEVPPDRSKQLAERNWIKPPLNPFFRAWVLLATAGGAGAHHQWYFWIPVVGPVLKSNDQRAAFKEQIRRTGRDMLGENKQDYAGPDLAIDILVGARGWMGAVGQALLFGGAGLFFAGTTLAAIDYINNQNLQRYAIAISTIGVTGIAAAGSGALLILAREIPEKLWMFVVPLTYGICPPPQPAVAVE